MPNFITDFMSSGRQNTVTKLCAVRCVSVSVKSLSKHAKNWRAYREGRIVDRPRPHVLIGSASDSFVKGDDADHGTLIL